jgi:hypothetical protein
MISMALAEARDLPIMTPYHAYWNDAAETLAAAWRTRRRRTSLKAVITLALSFDTHRTLTHGLGMSTGQAVELMARLVESVPPP